MWCRQQVLHLCCAAQRLQTAGSQQHSQSSHFLPSGISMMIMVIARNTNDYEALGTGRSMPSTAFLTKSIFVYPWSSREITAEKIVNA